MHSIKIAAPSEVTAAFDALDAAVAMIGELNLGMYGPAVRLAGAGAPGDFSPRAGRRWPATT